MPTEAEIDQAMEAVDEITGLLTTGLLDMLGGRLQPDILRTYLELIDQPELAADEPDVIKAARLQCRGLLAYFSVMEQAEAALTAKRKAGADSVE